MSTNSESSFVSLLGELGTRLKGDDLTSMKELAANNETFVAFENMCEQLYEYECVLNEEEWTQIQTIGATIGVDEVCWNRLRELIK